MVVYCVFCGGELTEPNENGFRVCPGTNSEVGIQRCGLVYWGESVGILDPKDSFFSGLEQIGDSLGRWAEDMREAMNDGK